MSSSNSARMHLLLEAPIGRMLWTLGAPNVTAIMILTSVTFADAWFVGRLGTVPLASIALVFPFQTLMQMMAAGAIGGGVTSAMARALGGNQTVHAEAVLWHSIVIACIMSAIYVAVLGIVPGPVFALLGGTGEVLDGAVRYARIAFGGAILSWLFYVLSAVLRGVGDTTTPARAIIVASIAQIALSGVLTLGGGPVPGLGVIGPAIAMVVCQGLAALYLAWHLMRGRSGIRVRPQPLRRDAFNDIMKVGGIGLLNSMAMAGTVVVATGLVGRYGTAALAGYGLGGRLELMLVPITFGIGAVLTAAVGANFGAGQYARARRIAWTGAAVAMLIMGAIGLAVTFLPGLWLDRFTDDPQAYAYGALYLGIAAPVYGVFGGGQALYFASQGTGRMVLPVSVNLLRFFIVAAGGSLAVALSWDVSAIFVTVAFGLAIVGLGMTACLYSPAWQPDAGH